MNRIRLLPEQVANQIAAGEVVERPASVVKELVENSLDAQASRITVEIGAGGRSLIRVTDNGVGMSKDDALMCLERHATSKIQRAEDLQSISTMGFRGEALPSIASVSRFKLVTREAVSPSGEATQVIVTGGKITEVASAGGPQGTSIEVRQLFYNLPARRKFLRSEETESAHIQHYLTLVALARPDVGLTYIRDGSTLWQLPPAQGADKFASLQERMTAVSGQQSRLIPVSFQAALPEFSSEEEPFSTASVSHSLTIWGLTGSPGVSRSTREDQHLFVNFRPIEHRGLNYALMEGYHTALMKGRYPVCCLFLEMHPSHVDVNIHPSKKEVKFHQERSVKSFVAEAIRQSLLAYHSPPVLSPAAGPAETSRVIPSALETEDPQLSQTDPEPGAKQFSTPRLLPPTQIPLPVTPLHPWPQRVDPFPALAVQPPAAAPVAGQPQGVVPLLQVPLRLAGVIGRLYVVLESDRGLVLLDQHAAHERILFEQMLKRLEQRAQAPSQRLLLPETIELSIRDAQFLKEQLTALSRLGVGISEFGERTFLLDALPPFVKATHPKMFVVGLIDELKAAGSQVNTLRLGEHVVAKTVCRHAVKANDPLSPPELEKLVEDLRRCDMPYTCPHGRPTLIEMNYRELEKKFGRSQ